MAGLSIRIWSDDPPDEKLGLVVGAIFFVVGSIMLAKGLVHLASQPWDLSERGVEVLAAGAERDPFTGDRYRIQVEGKTYLCHRGEEKLGQPRMVVLYDPEDPSRCRAKDTADRPGTYEATFGPMSIMFTLMGLSIGLARVAEPREPWARTDPSGLLRPKIMWISRGLAVLAVVLMFISLPLFFGGGGGTTSPGPPVVREDGASTSSDEQLVVDSEAEVEVGDTRSASGSSSAG